MKSLVLSVTFGLVLIFAGCSPKTGSEQKSEGELAFKRNCQSCHVLPRASLKSDREWPDIVAKYGHKIKLSREQVDLISAYLIANN